MGGKAQGDMKLCRAQAQKWDPRIVRMKQPNDTDTLFDASGVDLTTQSCGVAGCR